MFGHFSKDIRYAWFCADLFSAQQNTLCCSNHPEIICSDI